MQDLHAIATWATTAFEERNVAVVEEFLYNATYSTWGAIYATTENTTTAWRARANLLHIVFVEPFEGFQVRIHAAGLQLHSNSEANT